ncbi:DsbA family protein, partial [Patescibacteria group bacterium]|nr:DsbA family protein [Patescibacteria group bacterium]
MKKLFTLLIFLPAILLTSCGYENGDNTPMMLGDSDAPVLIEEFSDIQCPACGIISPQIEELARNNSDIVRLDYYHFPLSYHEYAFIGAEATECAANQGEGWEYLAMAFANQKSLSDDFFYSMAEDLGLDMDTFIACVDNNEKKEKILSHLREGKSRQI